MKLKKNISGGKTSLVHFFYRTIIENASKCSILSFPSASWLFSQSRICVAWPVLLKTTTQRNNQRKNRHTIHYFIIKRKCNCLLSLLLGLASFSISVIASNPQIKCYKVAPDYLCVCLSIGLIMCL